MVVVVRRKRAKGESPFMLAIQDDDACRTPRRHASAYLSSLHAKVHCSTSPWLRFGRDSTHAYAWHILIDVL